MTVLADLSTVVGLAVLCGLVLWLRHLLLAEKRARAALVGAYGEMAAGKQRADGRAAQFEAALEGMAEGVLLVDPALRLLYWNARYPVLEGIPAGVLQVGMRLEEVLRVQAEAGEFGLVDVDQEVTARLAQLPAPGATLRAERQRLDGGTIDVRMAAQRGGGYAALVVDVTERRAAEAAQREARMLAERAADRRASAAGMVGQDLRMPLRALVDCLVLLDEDARSTTVAGQAVVARQGAEALRDLFDDLGDAMAEDVLAGRDGARQEVFDPVRLVRAGVALFAARAASRGVRLLVEVESGVPPALLGDARRMRMVVLTLLGVVLRQARPGDMRVQLAAVRDQGEAMLRLVVADMAPYRPVGSGGVMSDLVLPHRLARLMGGRAGLAGIGEDGQAFWVLVPMVAVALTQSAGSVAHRPHPRRRLVLLVEDIPVNQVVTATQLRRDGHRVDIAGSGAEALRMAAATPYDIVLMDLMMPGMSGYEAAERMRALRGPAGQVAIFALTANTSEEDRARCLQAGMQGMLSKPVSAAELAETLQRGAAPVRAARIGADGVLDSARLDEIRRGLPPGVFATLTAQCLVDMRVRIGQLQGALAAGRAEAIGVEAHALAGMASSYGLAAFERQMRAVMAASRSGDVAAAQVAAADMVAGLEEGERALLAWLEPPAG